MRIFLLSTAIIAALPCCSRRDAVVTSKKTSSSWGSENVSLTGEYYPAVSLIGAAESLEDYLRRIDFSSPTITLYLEHTLEGPIQPENRAAYDEVLDQIFAHASAICQSRRVTAKRGIGGGGGIKHGEGAEPKLILHTFFRSETASTEITISNQVREPYSWVCYVKYWRDAVKFKEEIPFPPLGQK